MDSKKVRKLSYPHFIARIDNSLNYSTDNIRELIAYVNDLPDRLFPIYVQCVDKYKENTYMVHSALIGINNEETNTPIELQILEFVEFCMEEITNRAFCIGRNSDGKWLKQIVDYYLIYEKNKGITCKFVIIDNPGNDYILDNIGNINEIKNAYLLYAVVLYNRMKGSPIGVK